MPRQLTKARMRPPTIKIRHRSGILSQSAVTLLSEGGERFICICRSPQGDVYLKPLEVPADAVAIRPLIIPTSGQPRLSPGDIEPGDYELVWRGDLEAAVLQRITAATGSLRS